MTREEQINDKARELAKKFFPDGENIWARENIEATKVELACLEMAKYLQEERWISVEDELPEEGDMVLVALKNRIMTITTTSYCVDGEWYDYGNKIHGGVTHWMPLPNPPKKGGER